MASIAAFQSASATATRSLLSDKQPPATISSAASQQPTTALPAPDALSPSPLSSTTQMHSHPDPTPVLHGQGNVTDNYAQAQAQATTAAAAAAAAVAAQAATAGTADQTHIQTQPQTLTNGTMREKKREVTAQLLASHEYEAGMGYSSTNNTTLPTATTAAVGRL